ncbi:hypothetical protein BU26DRAFT_84990 [Trematosphaeria pertusa]|uniref:Uncharacterized protein n=1 Tax=Trematosphaeria pertusa TaxID=390896 RepID=A0A6A6I571_9PLEO|nr:uncharacterized protein BU26DRAFT_84990 [Trematosphaeria pertusa]KAF2244730.1 hypothetical protein BU26DRAFT_84990 [Trematosphaeria pertusa]
MFSSCIARSNIVFPNRRKTHSPQQAPLKNQRPLMHDIPFSIERSQTHGIGYNCAIHSPLRRSISAYSIHSLSQHPAPRCLKALRLPLGELGSCSRFARNMSEIPPGGGLRFDTGAGNATPCGGRTTLVRWSVSKLRARRRWRYSIVLGASPMFSLQKSRKLRPSKRESFWSRLRAPNGRRGSLHCCPTDTREGEDRNTMRREGTGRGST